MSSSQISRNWRRFGPFLLAAGLCVPTARAQTNTNPAAPDPNPPSPRKPCIILIVADDLGYGDLGCYGQTKIKTPNLDKLAAEGMRFTSYYAGSSLSAPSRAALLTGKHTGHTPIRGAAVFPVPADELMLQEILKQSGYATAAAGKWSLGGVTPAGHRGFDEWAGFLNDPEAQDYYPQILSRTRNGQDAPAPGATISQNLNGNQGRYANDLFTEAVTNFFGYSKPEARNNYRGFFAYLAPTLPYASPETGVQSSAGAVVPGDEPYAGNTTWLPAERTRAAMITRLDSNIGQLLARQKELTNDKNSIIIFTSATGPQHDAEIDPAFFHSTGPLRGFKHELYEGAIRVPLIVRWPLQIRPGTTNDLPCAAWDLLPTLAEAARAKAPKDIDGISLLPALMGKTQTNRHEFLYWELHDHGFKQAVRMGDWKAVRLSADGPFELYNLKNDPGEKTNVAGQNPEVVAKIAGLLKTARTDDPNWPIPREPPASDAK